MADKDQPNWAIKTSEGMQNQSENEIMAEKAEEKNVIKIYGTIGREVWADDVEHQLENMEGDVTVKINSVGGSVLEAIDIFNALKAYKGEITTVNMGKALSAGSYIFLAGTKRIVMSNSLTMIHAARMDMAGATETQMDEAKKMLSAATLAISKEYSKALGSDLAMAKTLLDSGDNWYDASEALESGLATEMVEPEHQATSAVLMAELAAAFDLPEKYLTKLENEMNPKEMIEKLSALCGDASLILNCVKAELSYEQSLEAIIKNMEEEDKKPEANEDEKVEATEEEDKVEATEEEEMTASEKMDEFLKSNLDEEKYAEYEEMVKSMEEDKPEAQDEEVKPEAQDEEVKPEAQDDEEVKPEATEEDKMENEDEDEDKMKALLKTGVKPVAVSKSPSRKLTATQSWNGQIEDRMVKVGCTRIQAISHINKLNPELRQRMIDEANG